jgi:RNA polymerase sigma-70 factor (ECF subfamily)
VTLRESHRNPGTAIDVSIASARSGSFAELGRLLDYYRDYLLRVAQEQLQSELAPKCAPSDLVQETFLQAASAFPQFRGTSEEELRAWLRQILMNNLRDTVRFYSAQRRDRSMEVKPAGEADESAATLEPSSPHPSPSEACCAIEDQAVLRSALARLSEAERIVIELRSMRGLSFAEMAGQLNKTPEAARKQWARAVDRLTRELSRGGSDES